MPSLHRDSRGAVMILAVFMAMIALGALYYLVGLGDAILGKERMQDAADATAFSSAVIHARGMNLLALLNIIMASVLAVLVLLSMLASLFSTGAKALAVAALLFPGAAGGIAPLNTAARSMRAAERRAKPAVERVLRGMHELQKPLSQAIPMIASLNAAKLSSQSYGPVVRVGVTFPVFGSLPTETGKFDTLCTKAGEYAGTIAVFPLDAVLPSVVEKIIGSRLREAAKSLGKTYASFYCGDGPKPASPSFSTKVAIPKLNTAKGATCESKLDTDPERRGAACEAFAAEQKAALGAYNYAAGRCQGEGEPRQHCLQMRRRARSECNRGNGRGAKKIHWREVQRTRHFVLEGEGFDAKVVELESTVEEPGEKRSGDVWPCAQLGKGFVSNMTSANLEDLDAPLCVSKIATPPASVLRQQPGRAMDIPVREITDVLFCQISRKVESEISGNPLPTDAKKSTPQEMCNCAAQGEEMFQIRSVVLGDSKTYTSAADRSILVATMGVQAEQGPVGKMARLAGKIAAAQAEYYFDDADAKPGEWLWHMKWKARMRRLSFGRKVWDCPEKKNTCERGVLSGGALSFADVSAVGDFTRLLQEGASSVITH